MVLILLSVFEKFDLPELSCCLNHAHFPLHLLRVGPSPCQAFKRKQHFSRIQLSDSMQLLQAREMQDAIAEHAPLGLSSLGSVVVNTMQA